jgi:hypothetical protein
MEKWTVEILITWSRNKKNNRHKTIEELISEYAEYASQHGEGIEHGDHKKANKAHDKLIKIYHQIKEREALNHPMFKGLLFSSDPGVLGWAATHSLAISPKEAETVLIELGKIPNSLIAFSANMTLEEWRNGRLKLL